MNPLASSKCAGRVFMALAVVASIVLIVGCGSSGIIHSLGGGFSKSSLKGQYVISQTGIGVNQAGTASDPFSETIVFSADGSGNLTATCDDFDQVGGPFPSCPVNVAGTYSIASDGTGSMNIGGSNGFNYAITMIDDKHFYIIEQDVFETASGFGEMQDTTAFTAAPSGAFVFKAHEVDISSRVGGITITPQIFWMVNGTRAYFLANNTAAVEDGTFSQQQGAPFTALSSQAAFVMDGFDVAFKDRVGLFKPTSGGFNWNQEANSFDATLGIGTLTSLGTNGTYQLSSNGRVTVTVNNVTSSLVFYLSSANTGFIVQEDADIGGAFSQQASQ